MIDFVKAKIHSLAMTAAVLLVALQLIMPTMIDVVLGGLIVGLMWLTSKVRGD